MTTPPAGGETGARIRQVLASHYENVYVNPVGVVIVPMGHTSVFVHHEYVGDLELIAVRASILQNLSGTPALFEHVALHATLFKLGDLYLFAEGDVYDLEFEIRVFLHWVPPEDLPGFVDIAVNTARRQAEELQPRFGGTLLNPSGETRRRIFAEEALGRNKVVSDVLDAALDTQRVALMGAAEGAWMSPGDAVLGRAVFTMTQTDLWVAGWPRQAQAPAYWRIPYRDIRRDLARHEHGASDYLAQVADGRWLGIRMIDGEAADVMATIRADPDAHF